MKRMRLDLIESKEGDEEDASAEKVEQQEDATRTSFEDVPNREGLI